VPAVQLISLSISMTGGVNINKEKGVVIAFLISVMISGSAGAYPPPAILKIDGNEQTSGIGDNCWREENQTYQICSDTFSIITPTEPLLTGSPFKAYFRFTIKEPPDEAGFMAIRVTDDDELKAVANGSNRAWRLTPEHFQQQQVNGTYSKMYKLPAEPESDINLSLLPGLYVLNVFVKWEEKGDVSYGFLVKVYNPAAEVTTQTATATESAKSGTSSLNEQHKISPTEKVAGFESVLAITMLLAVYAPWRKKK
jgi:hypothetical protein